MFATVLGLGFAVSFLSGFLGIGGGILMAPALLYIPPLLGAGTLDMKAVTGLTITQGLFACLSGVTRHSRYRFVSRPLILAMGPTIGIAALAGAVASKYMSNEALMVLFALLALVAAVLMLRRPPEGNDEEVADAEAVRFSKPRAVSIAASIGLLGGMVGQGGSFILIPLMLTFLGLPTRLVLGSNLGIVFFSSLAGATGKLATGQIPWLLAAAIVAGALPGAQLGGIASRRTAPKVLRWCLAGIIAIVAVKIGTDALSPFIGL